MLDNLRASLAKARATVFSAVSEALSGRGKLSAEEMSHLRELLISADVGVVASDRLLEAIGKGPMNMTAMERLKSGMLVILKESQGRLKDNTEGGQQGQTRPEVWLVCGVNGSGKTTSVGKLGFRLAAMGKRVIMAAADTYRAAAGQQLEIWARRAGAELITSKPGADPAAVAYDAVAAAQARGADYLLLDTAGRLHNKKHLQDELHKIWATVGKRMPGAPHRGLLVLDATTGQSGLAQARLFSEAARIDGIILTKLDGTAKGGIVLAIAQELGLPVAWVGTGEGPDDLNEFIPEEYIDGLLSQ